jgi:hypothetical protein
VTSEEYTRHIDWSLTVARWRTRQRRHLPRTGELMNRENEPESSERS